MLPLWRGASPPFVSAGCGTSLRRLLCASEVSAPYGCSCGSALHPFMRARADLAWCTSATRRGASEAWLHGALRRVQSTSPVSVASRRSARALLCTLAPREACSARLWRVTSRRRVAARRMRGGAARRMAEGKEAEKKAVPRWTHARAAGAFFDCLPARETCAGACCAVHGLRGVGGVRGAPSCRLGTVSASPPRRALRSSCCTTGCARGSGQRRACRVPALPRAVCGDTLSRLHAR